MYIDKNDIEWAVSLLVSIGCTWYASRKPTASKEGPEKEMEKEKEPKKHKRRKRK